MIANEAYRTISTVDTRYKGFGRKGISHATDIYFTQSHEVELKYTPDILMILMILVIIVRSINDR